MRLLLAIFVPWLQFFTIGRYWAGLICLLLQITLIGWLPAVIWSVYALANYETDQKLDKLLEREESGNGSKYARNAPASSDQDGGGDE